MSNIKPFISYAGGKTKLLPQILKLLPQRINHYFEPFVGGGSVFMAFINNNINCNGFTITDINQRLINCYQVIKNNVEDLINELHKDNYKNELPFFIKNKDRFNEDSPKSSVEEAALFIYLNKCCFNGLYRENSSGKFNVAFGTMKNSTIYDDTLLRNISSALQINNVDIHWADYSQILDVVEEGDFVYMDPPYDNTFTDYTQNKFDKSNQLQVKAFFDELTKKNVKCMLSNSSTDFINDLYKDYNIHKVYAKYSINRNGEERKNLKEEVIIINY